MQPPPQTLIADHRCSCCCQEPQSMSVSQRRELCMCVSFIPFSSFHEEKSDE